MTHNSSGNGIVAQLVFDGGDDVYIPEAMGSAREDQLLGTPAERLTELAGRVCYDSLGKGRPSFTSDAAEGYHDHIKQVGHGSVQEHFNFTVEIPDPYASAGDLALVCCNRPGVILMPSSDYSVSRLTVNLRSVLQWLKWSEFFYDKTFERLVETNLAIATTLFKLGHELAPHIIPASPPGVVLDGIDQTYINESRVVTPINDHERWVSMYMTGSRGLSHELVRHGDFTAISQRSTRYVDESEGDWVQHPLITQFLQNQGPDESAIPMASRCVIANAKSAYRISVQELEADLLTKGVDKQTARKQARGAARGHLGNALQTELIFSASVSQWKWMLNQRASQFADAEIRELFCGALGRLKLSRYADRFANWSLIPSPDGIGQVAVES